MNELIYRWLVAYHRRNAFNHLHGFVATNTSLTDKEHDELVTALDILRKYQ
jgi:hypothetical protein